MKNNYRIDCPDFELHNVFHVKQLAPNTPLSKLLGADFIRIESNQVSEVHRHNNSRTVIIVTKGSAEIILNDEKYKISYGDRIFIEKGVYHGFKTNEISIEFVSIQSPPILDHEQGIFDKEIKE